MQWLYEKKSLRIELADFELHNGEQRFNLVVPPTAETLVDWVSYDIARNVGLLTPDYYPVRLFINDRYMGLYFYLSKIDESFLRKNARMPGSIYSGDRVFDPSSAGDKSNKVPVIIHPNGDKEALLWNEERVWTKDAARNVESAKDRSDIQRFIKFVNYDNPDEFYEAFRKHFDQEKYYLYLGMDSLLGSSHHDLFHNHKLYVDPYKGRYEPIEWDIRFWNITPKHKDYALHPILDQVIRNPVLEYERDKIGYRLLAQHSVTMMEENIRKRWRLLRNELVADGFRRATKAVQLLAPNDKAAPISMKDLDSNVEKLIETYHERHDYLRLLYESADAAYLLTEPNNNAVFLDISVNGNSPIELDLKSLIAPEHRHQASWSRIHQGEKLPLTDDQILLYPGRQEVSGNALEINNPVGRMLWGNYHFSPSPLHYRLRVDGVSLAAFSPEHKMAARNAITKSNLALNRVDQLEPTKNTVSVHPWSLPEEKQFESPLVLDGKIHVMDDQVFQPGRMVIINPGTHFFIAPGKSLLFFTQVIANGTFDKPIRFSRLDSDKPWGSVVIHGRNANGSRLQHFEISGGSTTEHGLTQYPGSFNIHALEEFSLSHCKIERNSIGDDAIHIAYATGSIDKCQFSNSLFDALDADISDITIRDSYFTKAGNDGIDLMKTKAKMENIQIQQAGDKCFSFGERSEVQLSRSSISNCNIGIAIKDGSKAHLHEVRFKNTNQSAISLYQKNPRYDSGGEVNGERLYGINANHIEVGENSRNHISPSEYQRNL